MKTLFILILTMLFNRKPFKWLYSYSLYFVVERWPLSSHCLFVSLRSVECELQIRFS